MLGYHLSKKGLKVLIIDKKRLPRYKSCGGGLTGRALDVIPFDVRYVVEDFAYTAKISVQNSIITCRRKATPLMGTVMRDRFDYFLVRQAERLGAAVRDNTTLMSVAGEPGHLKVKTSMGELNTKIIVGADGVNSRVAKELKLKAQTKHMTAVEAEVYLEARDRLEAFRNTVHFDFGVVPRGYGWVFPKKDHVSVGLLTVSEKASQINRYFDSYLKIKTNGTGAEIRSYRGHLIPYGPGKSHQYATDAGLVVGDAAGITDPITGEGIYYAVRGAEIASEVISDHLLGKSALRKYKNRIEEEFLRDIRCAQRLGNILYKSPQLSYRILRGHGSRIANNHVKIISGEKTYTQLHKEVFSVNGIRSLFRKQHVKDDERE